MAKQKDERKVEVIFRDRDTGAYLGRRELTVDQVRRHPRWSAVQYFPVALVK